MRYLSPPVQDWQRIRSMKSLDGVTIAKLPEQTAGRFMLVQPNYDVVAYLDQAEFKTFWDIDAKRVEDAVRAVGKV